MGATRSVIKMEDAEPRDVCEEEELDESRIEDMWNRERIERGHRIPRKERPVLVRFHGEERFDEMALEKSANNQRLDSQMGG
jgi:hypothetical protein